MESKLLSSLGKVAGLGGIALGVFLLLFQGVLQKEFLPKTGLGSAQAYTVILTLMILTFGIAGIGIIAWLIGRTTSPRAPIPGPGLVILAGLIIIVLGAVVYVGAQVRSDAPPEPGAPAPITVTYKVCSGEYERACQPHDVYVYCYTDVAAWAKARCGSYTVQRINTYGGNKCGYSIDAVICTAPR
jgi:hypothetical protein